MAAGIRCGNFGPAQSLPANTRGKIAMVIPDCRNQVNPLLSDQAGVRPQHGPEHYDGNHECDPTTR